METDINSMPTPEDLGLQEDSAAVDSQTGNEATAENDQGQDETSRKHNRDHGNRRYKMFSNHSSWNDMPHTNTSF